MNKNKYLFGIAGVAIGFLISFFLTQSYNKNNAVAVAGSQSPAMAGGAGGQPSQQGMMASVAATLENAKNNPKDFQAQIEAARTYYQIGRVEEAITFLKKAHEINPKEVGIPAIIGELYFTSNNYAEAEEWYNRAIQAAPGEAGLHVALAETYMRRDKPEPEKAIQSIERALKIEPKDTHALVHLIDAYLLKKDVRGAEDTFNRLKETDPKNQKLSTYQGLIADLKAGRPVSIPKE